MLYKPATFGHLSKWSRLNKSLATYKDPFMTLLETGPDHVVEQDRRRNMLDFCGPLGSVKLLIGSR